MSAAAARNVGLRRATRSSIDTIELCTARLIAATATAVAAEDRRRDRAQPVRELLVVDREALLADALQLEQERRARRQRVRAPAREVDPGERGLLLGLVQEREQHLAERGAIGREARADMEIEVDLALARARAAAPLDVDDVEAVEDRHVHGVAGRVAQLPQMRRGDLAQLHRVDRREPEVEHPRAEAVLLRRRILLEIAEGGERRDVAVGRLAAEPDVAAELADAEKWSSRAKGR